jgi:antitoxin FitA
VVVAHSGLVLQPEPSCPRSLFRSSFKTEVAGRLGEALRQVLAAEDEPSFAKLAVDLRKLTRGRRHTPSEVLQREGRAER